MNQIHPIHHSLKKQLLRTRRVPNDMDTVPLASDQAYAFTNIALSIFTDCANAGVGFQDSLLAIYLSGLQHGVKASK
jgi:hypothetical protein